MGTHNIQAKLENADMRTTGDILNVPSASGNLISWGTTVPTAATAGYAPSCLFFHTDGSVTLETLVYINKGTAASCLFVPYTTLGNKAHGGLLMGAGVSATPYTMVGASKSALSFYVTTADTADSNRAAYFKLFLTGAAAGGEALRAFGSASGTGLVALRGAHISAEVTGSGTVTGEAMPVKATMHFPTGTLGGTISGVASEFYAEAAGSTVSNAALFRGIISGESTGAGLINAAASLIALDGITIGSAGQGKMVNALAGDVAPTHVARIMLNNVAYWILLRNAVT